MSTLAIPGTGERLLWITSWGIWPTSENWELFAALRRGYNERRSIEDAPAILASATEVDELAAFVQVSLIFGWDAHLVGTGDLLSVFVSHDEFVEYSSPSNDLLLELRKTFTNAQVPLISDEPPDLTF